MKPEVKAIVDAQRKSGAELINAVVSRAEIIASKKKDEIFYVDMVLDKEVNAYRKDDNGDYLRGTSYHIKISWFNLKSIILQSQEFGSLANRFVKEENFEALCLLLEKATISDLHVEVKAGLDKDNKPLVYINPFSKEEKPKVIEHDNFYDHLLELTLSQQAKEDLKEVRRSILLGK